MEEMFICLIPWGILIASLASLLLSVFLILVLCSDMMHRLMLGYLLRLEKRLRQQQRRSRNLFS